MAGMSADVKSLLVDIGNTNIKWCWLERGLRSEVFFSPHANRSDQTMFSDIWDEYQSVSRILVANVASPAFNEGMKKWTSAHWKCTPMFLKSEKNFAGVSNAYLTPEHLGIDRWLTLVAAHKNHKDHTCIVDCGTAITIDLLHAEGTHLGGLILPGLAMMRKSLFHQTNIPKFYPTADDTPILGLDTGSAVASASIHSAAALVDRVVEYGCKSIGARPVVIFTGSDAQKIRSVLSIEARIEPDLIMQGLAVYAAEIKV